MKRAVRLDLSQVVKRFPEQGALVRRLALRDSRFREMCEDYLAALSSIAFFEAMPSTAERPEIAEYTQVIAQLEAEIYDALSSSDRQKFE